jgi:hypothetical protein
MFVPHDKTMARMRYIQMA